jgi:hypothetical protein
MDVSEIQVSIPDVSMAEAENSAAAHTYKTLQEAYSNLFRIFYNNKTADIPCDNFKRIKAIVELADLYCSLPIIAGAIELLVIKFSRHPRGTICVHSDDIIIIANKIHSKTLYHESFVHLVGQVGSEIWRVKKDSLPKEIRLQVLEEYPRISDIKKMVDRDIIKYICSIVRSTSGRNNIAAQKASEVEDICGDNWYCEGYNDIESCKEQRGEFGMYQAIRDLGVEPTTYHFTVDMLLDITLKLDEVCPRGDLICANLSEYPWEEADDW